MADKYVKEVGTPQSSRSGRGGSGSRGGSGGRSYSGNTRAPLSPQYIEPSRSRDIQRVCTLPHSALLSLYIPSSLQAGTPEACDVNSGFSGVSRVAHTLASSEDKQQQAEQLPQLRLGARHDGEEVSSK